MKKFKNVICFLSILILILGISPTWAMEDDGKEVSQNPPHSEVFPNSPFENHLIQQIQELQTTIGVLQQTQEAHKKEMRELYEHIGEIVHNKPSVYKELIPTSKLLWMTLCYGFYRCITNFTTFYGQTGSYQYGFSMGVEALLTGGVTCYYVCSLLGILSTRSTNIPKPPSAEKN